VQDEEHHTWSVCFTDSQARRGASTGRWHRVRSSADDVEARADQGISGAAVSGGVRETAVAEASARKKRRMRRARLRRGAWSSRGDEGGQAGRAIPREPVEKQTARELFAYIVEQGKKDYQVQRYKGWRDERHAALGDDDGPGTPHAAAGEARRHWKPTKSSPR